MSDQPRDEKGKFIKTRRKTVVKRITLKQWELIQGLRKKEQKEE